MPTKYIREKRALFLHIPRTGGNWISRAIDQVANEGNRKTQNWGLRYGLPWAPSYHRPLQLHMRGPIGGVDFVFAFVRHPLTMYESWWKTMHPGNRLHGYIQRKWSIWRKAAENWRPDFGDWVRAMTVNEPMFYTRLYELFLGPDGGELCAFIGRTETLQEDFFEVMRILGYQDRIEQKREKLEGWGKFWVKTARPSGDVVWTKELREMVCRNERLSIKRFYGRSSKSRRKYAELSEHVPSDWVSFYGKRMWGKRKPPFDMKKENPNWGREK